MRMPEFTAEVSRSETSGQRRKRATAEGPNSQSVLPQRRKIPGVRTPWDWCMSACGELHPEYDTSDCNSWCENNLGIIYGGPPKF
jgi:hypothetical protein